MSLIATPSKTIKKQVKVIKNGTERLVTESQIRTFLWDNPELRKAFRKAQGK